MPENPSYETSRAYGLHRHEVFYGTANRKLSIEDGLIVYLTPEMHNMSNRGVHSNREFDLYLKQIGEEAWMDYYNKTEEEFIERYGRSYL